MLETDSIIIIALLLVLICSCTSLKSGFSVKAAKIKKTNPAKSKFGDLEVECGQHPSYSRSIPPNKVRIPCGATAVRKLVNSSKDETYGQEGFEDTKEEWDSDMASNIYTRFKNTSGVMYEPENMASRGPTAQRRNQVELDHRKKYN